MTHANPENQDGQQTTSSGGASAEAGRGASGLPLRGFAMVLVAVAIVLLLWAFYALTGNDDSDTAADNASGGAAATTTASAAPAVPSAAPETPAPAPEQAPESPAEGDAAADTPADAAPAPIERINVLNNSTEFELARQTADALIAAGDVVGEVGNLDGEVLTVPETTVYYQPGHEQEARELADRLGAIARPYNEALPTATNGANDLTLVLAGPVTLG